MLSEKMIEKVQSLGISRECAAYSIIEVARYIDLCKYLSKKDNSSWKEKLIGRFRVDNNLPVFFQTENNEEGRLTLALVNESENNSDTIKTKKVAFKEIAGIFYPM